MFTRDGDKAVETLKPGDEVLSFPRDQIPPDRMREPVDLTYVAVTAVTQWVTPGVTELEVLCFAAGVKETLRVASSQPVHVHRQGWVPAASLSCGTVLMNSAFGNNMCAQATTRDEPATVFCVALQDDHAFYIGKSDTWVGE